jgi:WD40 repeat protein
VINANGARLCTVDKAHTTLDVWDLDRGELLLRGRTKGAAVPPQAGPAPRHVLAFAHDIASPGVGLSPDGRRVVVRINPHFIQVHDVDSGRCTSAFVSEGIIGPIEFSPDSRRFALPSANTTARAWSTEGNENGQGPGQGQDPGGKPIGPVLPHPTFVRRASFSSDGERLVTYCEDGAFRIWDAVTGELVVPEFQTGSMVRKQPWFSRDDRRIALLDAQGTSTQWDLPSVPVAREWVLDLVHLLTGQHIDQTGISYLPAMTFRDNPAPYRRAWLASRGLADDPAAQP